MTTMFTRWWTISAGLAGPGAAGYETSDWETVVTDLLAGEYSTPIGVFAFNTAEGWSRDVSADVAARAKTAM
jgi:hypothetical protein